mgnify:FL=1
MTVKELIEKLQDIPENTPIYTLLTGYYDSEDGLLKLEGFISSINYDTKGYINIVSDFDKATYEV